MVIDTEIVSMEQLYFEAVFTDKMHIHGYKYIPLYELLTEYWDKSLLKIPDGLRERTQNAVPSWDEIESSNPLVNRVQAIAIRKKRVKWFDIKRDPYQEWETYIALQGFIKGGYQIGNYPSCEFIPDQSGYEIGILPERMADARAASRFDIADMLEKKVKKPLEGIISEHGVHWPNSAPVLWSALSKFKELALSRLIKEYKENGNEECAYELKWVDLYILRILRLDGSRIKREYPLIEDEWKKNNILNAGSLSEPYVSGNKYIEDDRHEREEKKDFDINPDNILMPEILKQYLKGKKGITNLVIPIAWKIECSAGRKATPEEVMKVLQSRVDTEDILLESFQDGIKWQTKGLRVKDFDVEACSKALERWEAARIEADNKTLDRY